ncbi:hypothetical protein niasHS_013402 [Heterodera schachtii]|uniref:Uncharacterized protein n=1 Tax=Heterodera schachtii TaxID=97005 RepID=A0ABD2I3U6_HETSC
MRFGANTAAGGTNAGGTAGDSTTPGTTTTASMSTNAAMPRGNSGPNETAKASSQTADIHLPTTTTVPTSTEPCPVQTPAPQVPLPEPLPALPTFIAPPPQVLRQPPMVPLVVGTQNDCCCNCVQTTCRAMGIAGGRAHGARTTSFGSAIWEELFGGGRDAGPPPSPKLMMATEAKCNSRVLEEAILEV